jgi:hypothetical protein
MSRLPGNTRGRSLPGLHFGGVRVHHALGEGGCNAAGIAGEGAGAHVDETRRLSSDPESHAARSPDRRMAAQGWARRGGGSAGTIGLAPGGSAEPDAPARTPCRRWKSVVTSVGRSTTTLSAVPIASPPAPLEPLTGSRSRHTEIRCNTKAAFWSSRALCSRASRRLSQLP